MPRSIPAYPLPQRALAQLECPMRSVEEFERLDLMWPRWHSLGNSSARGAQVLGASQDLVEEVVRESQLPPSSPLDWMLTELLDRPLAIRVDDEVGKTARATEVQRGADRKDLSLISTKEHLVA